MLQKISNFYMWYFIKPKDKNGMIEIKEKVNGHITNGTYYLNTAASNNHSKDHKSHHHHHRHHRRKPHRVSSSSNHHHHHHLNGQDTIMDSSAVLPVINSTSSKLVADDRGEASDLITSQQQSQLTSSKSSNELLLSSQQHQHWILYYSFIYAFRTLKDTRRRISQTVLSKVGSADETKDVQYDAHVEHFHSMISDMTQCKTIYYIIYIHCLYGIYYTWLSNIMYI